MPCHPLPSPATPLHRLPWPSIALHRFASLCIALHRLASPCIALHRPSPGTPSHPRSLPTRTDPHPHPTPSRRQRTFVPAFAGGWDGRAIGHYALISAPTWSFGVVAATFVGAPSGLFTMLAWATALTVPALTLLLPSSFALAAADAADAAAANADGIAAAEELAGGSKLPPTVAVRSDGPLLLLPNEGMAEGGGASSGGGAPRVRLALGRRWRAAAHAVRLTGVLSLAICLYAAVGKTANPTVRGPQVIGCVGWEIYKSNGSHFRGF